MSRVGKTPIAIPSGVTVDVKPGKIAVKGSKGNLEIPVDYDFKFEMEDGKLVVARPSDQKRHRAHHGLYRALIANMVTGVSKGFAKTLEIEGVGYAAKAEGPNKLSLNVGFNAPVIMIPPEGVTVATPKATVIEITGVDKQKVGQFAAVVRKVRPPEPYKGKGIRYEGEYIRRKAGKAIGGKA